MTHPDPRLRLRIHFGTTMIGPGKADLLDLIDRTGSISAAGRAMKMSYKRAWTLVDEMNNAYRAPLVISARGGSDGGGASLSETGRLVLDLYRQAEANTQSATDAQVSALADLLAQK